MNKVPFYAYVGEFPTPNSFTENSIGVYVTEALPHATIHVNGNNFNNCNEGIYLVNNMRIQEIQASDNPMIYMYDGIKSIGNDYTPIIIEGNHITTHNNSVTPDAGITVGNILNTNTFLGPIKIDNNVV